MKIELEELFSIIEILKAEITEHLRDGIEINIPHDYYWRINEEEVFNPENNPKSMLLGQVGDDWEELSRLLKKDSIPISYDILRLIAIFEKVRQNSKSKW